MLSIKLFKWCKINFKMGKFLLIPPTSKSHSPEESLMAVWTVDILPNFCVYISKHIYYTYTLFFS